MKTIPVEEYEPFGDEWKKEISKMTKPMLVNLLRKKLIDLQNFKYRPKKLIDDNMKLTAEQFLREKLESEISSFGDGTTEFHTRDIEHLLKCLEEKDNEIHEFKNTKPLIEEIEQQKMQCSVYHNDILNLEGEKAGLIDEIADLKSRLELSEQKVKLNYNTAIDLESKLKASGSVNEGLKSDVDFWKNKSFTLQQENLKHTL